MKILPWRIMGPTPQYYVFHLLKTPENSDKAKQLLFLHLSNTLYAPGMVLGPEIFLSTNRQTNRTKTSTTIRFIFHSKWK